LTDSEKTENGESIKIEDEVVNAMCYSITSARYFETFPVCYTKVQLIKDACQTLAVNELREMYGLESKDES